MDNNVAIALFIGTVIVAVLWVILPVVVMQIHGKCHKTMMETIRIRELLERIASQGVKNGD